VIALPRSVRVYAYPNAADLRRGYNGLFALVQQGLGRNPLSGDLYLFTNAKRTGCKVLLWDGTGLCIYMKRLERGRFAALWREGESAALRLTASELALYIEGCTLVGKTALSPREVEPRALAASM
jgi:transposase